MEYVSEVSRKVPIITETDVLVVGSGPADLAAALSVVLDAADTRRRTRIGSNSLRVARVSPVFDLCRRDSHVQLRGVHYRIIIKRWGTYEQCAMTALGRKPPHLSGAGFTS